jgi:cilia- and flagella-associated protein 251
VVSYPSLELYRSHFEHGYPVSKSPITQLTFSPDDAYLAFADANHAVGLLKDTPITTTSKLVVQKFKSEWNFVGKNVAHVKAVCALAFHAVVGELAPVDGTAAKASPEDQSQDDDEKDSTTEAEVVTTSPPRQRMRLFSVSQDRYCVEYDVHEATPETGFHVLTTKRIEQTDRPLAALVWHAADVVHPEDLLLVATAQFKLRTSHLETQTARMTALGPTFEAPIKQLCFMPASAVTDRPSTKETPVQLKDNAEFLAFATSAKCIGLIKLPLEGNPHASMGVIAHPSGVRRLVRSHDGTYLMSAGRGDSVIHQWRVNTHVLDAQLALRGQGIEPYLDLVDATGLGKEGPFYKEIQDYFYYAQIRAQGEEQHATRIIQDSVPLSEAPLIMQAMGFYPTVQEVSDMMEEMKFRHFLQAKGQDVHCLSLDELIRCRCACRCVRGWRGGHSNLIS